VLAGLSVWWRNATREWTSRIDAGGSLRTARQLDALLHRVITDEWRNAAARAYIADTAVAVAIALERVTEVLKEQTSALAGALRPDRFAAEPSPDPELDAVLTADLQDAVESALAVVWDRARTSSPSGAWDLAGERMREHLAEYDQHLALHDVNEPPPFTRPDRPRGRVHGGWGPPQHIAEVLAMSADGPLVQLCRSRHTNLLSLNRIRAVRFAPASMQEEVSTELSRTGHSPLLSDLHWTHSGSLAGLVRLVPPRSGVVDMVWNHEEEQLDWSNEGVTDA
jgi:hypothetical protein